MNWPRLTCWFNKEALNEDNNDFEANRKLTSEG